jgi:hypothetical protein
MKKGINRVKRDKIILIISRLHLLSVYMMCMIYTSPYLPFQKKVLFVSMQRD